MRRAAELVARCVVASIGLLLCLATPRPALSETPDEVDLRVTTHPGYARLVLDYGSWVGVSTHRAGATMTLRFTDPATPRPPAGFAAAALPELRAARFAPGAMVLDLAPGVTVRSLAAGSARVVDLIDPSGPSTRRFAVPAGPIAAIAAASVAAAPLAPTLLEAIGAVGVVSIEPAPPVSRLDDATPERTPRAPLAAALGAPLVLAFAPGTGAAAFQRGGTAVIVFDEPRALDQAALRTHPGAEAVEVQMLPDAVVLRLPLSADRALGLRHDGTDWTIDFAATRGPTDTVISLHAADGGVDLAVAGTGHVVAVPDGLTGDNLLVGTTTSGAYMAPGRRFAEFDVPATALGVLLETRSDRVALRMRADGYRVESGLAGFPLAVAAAPDNTSAAAAAESLSRSFDFPQADAAKLLRRLHAQVEDASAAPVLGRLPYRLAVAQTMVALGMGAEAQGVLQLAAADDPRGLADPPTQAMAAAAALLAGRLAETDGLAPTSPETDEHRLWRALRDAARLPDSATPDAATVAGLRIGLPLLLAYPATLTRALLPLAADTLLRGGDLASADRLLAERSGDPTLGLARAVAQQAHGRHEAALAGYDALTRGTNRSVRARAAFAALDLRVADRRITPAAAAEAGDRLIYAWRGDARERDARLRVAAWRGAAGEYRQQLEALRDALDAFPDPPDGIRQHLTDAFAAILQAEGGAAADSLSPLDLVALVQENTDLLPDGPAGEAMAEKLADRLAALDLPQRAEAVLERLAHDTAASSAKAALAARLAALELGEGQVQPALDALSRSAAPGLSPALTERRALLAARAQAALGDRPAALATLSPLADAPALLARASVQEDAHDWPSAAAALGAYADAVLPAAGALDVAQSGIVLRLASATAQAGDEAGLARLRSRYGARLHTADDAALLGVLTEQPVQGVADLPRLTKETEAAQRLPATLASQ